MSALTSLKEFLFALMPMFLVKWICAFVLMLRSYEGYAKQTDKQRDQLEQLIVDIDVLKSEIHRLRIISNLNQYFQLPPDQAPANGRGTK
jgi:hypothetical protein